MSPQHVLIGGNLTIPDATQTASTSLSPPTILPELFCDWTTVLLACSPSTAPHGGEKDGWSFSFMALAVRYTTTRSDLMKSGFTLRLTIRHFTAIATSSFGRCTHLIISLCQPPGTASDSTM